VFTAAGVDECPNVDGFYGCYVDSFALDSTGAGLCSKASKARTILSRDKRSARSLAILVVVFLVTWAPFEISAFVHQICGLCIPQSVSEIVFWLLWLNSTINPILYPFLQQRFPLIIAYIRIPCHP